MREFNKIYTNKNNKNLNQVEDYYNNIRDSYEKLFAKIKKVVEKTKNHCLEEAVYKMKKEGKCCIRVTGEEIEKAQEKAVEKECQMEIEVCGETVSDFYYLLRELCSAAVITNEEAIEIADAVQEEISVENLSLYLKRKIAA